MRSLTLLTLLLISCTALWAQNPHPLVNQPLVPASAAPGSAAFTLTVSGTGFASGAVLDWNGSPRTTTFLSSSSLQASISSTDVAHVVTASVTVVNPAPGGGVSNAVYFPVRQSAPGVAFAPEPNVSAVGGASAVGDFNHDGKLDLAVGLINSDGQTGTIYLYLGMGNGTFASPITTASTLGIISLTTGDFNNDGKLDLLVGTVPNGTFGPVQGIVFLGDNAGHFQEKTPFGSGDSGGPIAVGDLNGDGKLDVVFEADAQGSAIIYIFLGDGHGNFTRVSSAQGIDSTGNNAAIGDFNGDGKLDVAIPENHQLDIFLGNGNGTFQTYVPYSAACQNGPVVAADFDGDGKLDLVMGDLCVFLGNGDGSFVVGASYGPGTAGIAVGDFNGDGKLDVVTGSGSIQTFLGSGDGTFQNATLSGEFVPNTFQEVIPFGDFNRDGELDIVASGSSTQIGLQTTIGVSPGLLSYGSQKVGTTSPQQTVTITNVSSHGVQITGITITGVNSADFLQRNGCGAGLQVGKSCQVKVVFKPTAKGVRSAGLSISYQGPESPQIVSLSGTGT
jgi:hypothetical protein